LFCGAKSRIQPIIWCKLQLFFKSKIRDKWWVIGKTNKNEI
jgi:hypothetical protein